MSLALWAEDDDEPIINIKRKYLDLLGASILMVIAIASIIAALLIPYSNIYSTLAVFTIGIFCAIVSIFYLKKFFNSSKSDNFRKKTILHRL